MKRKLFAAMLLLLTAMLLAGCGGDRPAATPTIMPTSTVAPTAEPTAEPTQAPTAEPPTQSRVVVYDGPNVLTSSSRVRASVEGQELFVYDTPVNHGREFSYAYPATTAQVVIFDMESSARVEIEVLGAENLHDVRVTPLSYGIAPAVEGNKISFTLDAPANYTVEFADAPDAVASENAVHIFANPIEENPLSADNLPANTVYFAPGVYYADAIPVSGDHATVYLAGGAVVYGHLVTGDAANLTIRGRGILCGDLFDRTNASQFTLPIELQRCKNVLIEGISILNPAGWAVTLYQCEDVRMDNVKIITARANGDGISAQSCQNVLVSGGFVRTWDDSLVVKNVALGSTKNVVFDGVTVWTDLAQSCEVGYETYGATMEDIAFRNITILHNFHKAALSIHNCDQAAISGVTYENITIEDAAMRGDNQLDGENDYFIDMTVAFNKEWTKSGGERGSIRNVAFRNINVLQMADTVACRMMGEGAKSNISGVTIENVSVEGKRMDGAEALKLAVGAYVDPVNFISTADATGAKVTLPGGGSLPAEVIVVPSKHQEGLEVPDFAIIAAQKGYIGAKIDAAITPRLTYGSGDKAASKWNLAQGEAAGMEALLDGDDPTLWTLPGFTGLDDEFAALSFDFDAVKQIGTIRLTGDQASKIMRYYNLSVFAKKKADADGKETWVRQLFSADYGVSPQMGNYVDIKIAPADYYGIQLRLFDKKGMMYAETTAFAGIDFYPPSLTTGKAIVDVSEYEDVYDSGKMLDGDNATYFEGKKGLFPAYVAVDMGKPESVKYVAIHLPPLLSWSMRTQTIEILGSNDGQTYETALPATSYVFDAKTGNYVTIELPAAVQMRYIKLLFTGNSSGYGAQISELYVFGE